MTLNRQFGTILSKIIGTDVAVQNNQNKYKVQVLYFTPWLTDVDVKKRIKDLKKLFKATGVKIIKTVDEEGFLYIQIPCTVDDYETLLKIRGYLN